jgi:hypothetical protein
VELCEGFLFGLWITVGFRFDGEEGFARIGNGGVFVTVNAYSKGRVCFGCGGDEERVGCRTREPYVHFRYLGLVTGGWWRLCFSIIGYPTAQRAAKSGWL